MFRRLMFVFEFFALIVAFLAVTSFAKPVDSTEEKAKLNYNLDIDIDEIANREYGSVHGRILAVNRAHIHKRAAPQSNEGGGNAFTKIESANKANMTNLYQGDIIRDEFLEDDYNGNTRNALRWRKRLWTSRIIPYIVPGKMSHIKANLLKAIAQIEQNTCLRIVPYDWRVHKNYVEFVDTNGCASKVGKKYYEPGRQTISLGRGCNFPSTILHELMHTIGFFHEQARWDRDKYVKIFWENILDGLSDQFDKYGWRDIDNLNTSYDYKSVMHYDRKAFTKNGKPTIVAIGNENMDFKMADMMLSPRDIVEINVLYDCRTTRRGWTQWASWTPCDDKCKRTRERYCYHNGDMKSCKSSHIMTIYGVDRQEENCPSSICPAPVDGNWGRWSEWQPCSVSCDDGIQTRTRRCDEPFPVHGGKPCVGKSKESKICTRRRCRLDPDDTDFENYRLGMWSQSTDDKLDWTFRKGHTQTVNTGPMTDHTRGDWNGYYLYVESSRQLGSNAKLVSNWHRSTTNGGQCLKFYYSMYGRTTGTLWVQLEIRGKQNSKYWIFYKKGDQGSGWKSAVGNIDVDVGSSYQLTFEANVAQGYSDIAIDDVYIDAGLCNCQDKYVTCSGKWLQKYGCQTPSMRSNCKRTCQSCQVVDGRWGSWSKWQPCSVTCGVGSRSRARKCDSPAPSNGGRACAGQGTETQKCSAAAVCTSSDCKDNAAGCVAWSQNGECKKNPSYMLTNCRKSCKVCPVVDGRWGSWSKWQPCSVTCGVGSRSRARKCDSPAPSNGGRACAGQGTETQKCSAAAVCTSSDCKDNAAGCVAWSQNGECKKNPSYMLTNCRKSCKVCPVAVDGRWGSWSKWQPCSVTCGVGSRSRARKCDSPAPSNGGRACAGQGTETQKCSAAAVCTSYCQDKDRDRCPKWANAGECKKHPSYMLVNCAKSCQKCCIDSDAVRCLAWAKAGECNKNPSWMKVNCKKSCQQC